MHVSRPTRNTRPPAHLADYVPGFITTSSDDNCGSLFERSGGNNTAFLHMQQQGVSEIRRAMETLDEPSSANGLSFVGYGQGTDVS